MYNEETSNDSGSEYSYNPSKDSESEDDELYDKYVDFTREEIDVANIISNMVTCC